MMGESGPNRSSGARNVGSKLSMEKEVLGRLEDGRRGKRGWQFQTFA